MQEAKDNDQARARGRRAAATCPTSRRRSTSCSARPAPPRYVAILGYVAPDEASTRRSPSCARAIRDATRTTTTFGYGPRYLHSTGQLHKGGPPAGRFLQLLHDGHDDASPGRRYTSGTSSDAQALGDLQTLRGHGLPAERVRLEGDPAAGVREITKRSKEMR